MVASERPKVRVLLRKVKQDKIQCYGNQRSTYEVGAKNLTGFRNIGTIVDSGCSYLEQGPQD